MKPDLWDKVQTQKSTTDRFCSQSHRVSLLARNNFEIETVPHKNRGPQLSTESNLLFEGADEWSLLVIYFTLTPPPHFLLVRTSSKFLKCLVSDYLLSKIWFNTKLSFCLHSMTFDPSCHKIAREISCTWHTLYCPCVDRVWNKNTNIQKYFSDIQSCEPNFLSNADCFT